MDEPAIGESVKVEVDVTHTEYTRLVDAVELIDNILSGKTTAAAARWFRNAAGDKQERVINATAFLAKFVREDVLEG
jgi:hypothetical protein